MQSVLIKIAVFLFAVSPAFAECAEDVVSLRWAGGVADFTVEVADDFEERAVGLQNRAEMAARAGMLFVYPQPGEVAFWMDKTLIPLDMLFFDETGVLQKIHHNARPLDRTSIEGGDNIQFVLEINGGLARTYGIRAGAELRHPAIASDQAAWACALN